MTWKGEEGHGSGPTRKFFEKVAAELASEAQNKMVRVWRDVGDMNQEGLFPAALPNENSQRTVVLKRLNLIGQFIGKAIQQGQKPGLFLALPLLKLVLGDKVGFDDVRQRECAAWLALFAASALIVFGVTKMASVTIENMRTPGLLCAWLPLFQVCPCIDTGQQAQFRDQVV